MSLVKKIILWFLLFVPLVFILLFSSFLISRLAPGDPVMEYLTPPFTVEQYNAKFHELGLDRPIFEQFLFFYIGHLFTDNWIISIVILFSLTFSIAVIAAVVQQKYMEYKRRKRGIDKND